MRMWRRREGWSCFGGNGWKDREKGAGWTAKSWTMVRVVVGRSLWNRSMPSISAAQREAERMNRAESPRLACGSYADSEPQTSAK